MRYFLKLSEIPSAKVPDRIALVSKVQERYLKEKYRRTAVYIPTGVNPPQLTKPELIEEYGLSGNDYILFAARLVREKGAHYLIEAYKKIKTHMKLVIAGDAVHEESYKSWLYSLARDNSNIVFTGFVTGKRLRELFSNCYLFVLPSEIEGLPIALLEAMSYGNCCIASDIDENVEALRDYGYTFKSKDVGRLREILELLLSNSSLVEGKKRCVAEYVLKNFSWDDIALKFERLYASLLF